MEGDRAGDSAFLSIDLLTRSDVGRRLNPWRASRRSKASRVIRGAMASGRVRISRVNLGTRLIRRRNLAAQATFDEAHTRGSGPPVPPSWTGRPGATR